MLSNWVNKRMELGECKVRLMIELGLWLVSMVLFRCHELSLQQTELAITSVSSLLSNQLVGSESQRAGQSEFFVPSFQTG